ncbi:hypothetical protein ACFYRJ_17385 [Streptomyces sp. NPDC005531]|uniref:hypothetical protein n=1 Tax=Streptomyces sp. NPDC005531 TaxID=3364722 RepID=UPI0036969555
MRVKVSETCRVYWNYRVVDLAKGEEVEGEFADHLVSTGVGVDIIEGAPEAQAPEPPAELDIEASAAAVLAWVGDDPERAAEALTAESAKDKPRSTLVKQLEKAAAVEPVEE